MKIVTITDAAFVGETWISTCPMNLKNNTSNEAEAYGIRLLVSHQKFWNQKATYIILIIFNQDCYIASKLGKKPLIGHAHGSDLRTALTHIF